MSEDQPIKRVLVALDASSPSLSALRAGATLAAELEAELVGLFVEDVNLLRLARLPFSQEVRIPSAAAGVLSDRQMEMAMRIQAARARRALETAAARAGVSAVFRVVRGRVSLSVLAAALEADLVILGRVSRPVTRRLRVGSTARAVITGAPRSVLLQGAPPAAARTTVVTFDGSRLAWKGLQQAVSLSETAVALRVLLLAPPGPTAATWRSEVEQWLVQQDREADFGHLPAITADGLLEAAAATGCSLLIVGGQQAALTEEEVSRLLHASDCSILIVKE